MDPVSPPQQWWTLEAGTENALRDAAWSFASNLESSSAEQDRRANHLLYASQYLGRPLKSLVDFEPASSTASPTPIAMTGRSRNNLTRTLVDTAMSRFAKSETRVQFMTNGGTPGQEERSEAATDAANALIQQTGAEKVLRKAALHACVFDEGIGKVIQRDEGPTVDHVPAWEMMFDGADAHRGTPTIAVQRFAGDREALVAQFATAPKIEDDEEPTPDRQKAIDEAEDLAKQIRASGSGGMITSDHTPTDQHCLVYELWRLPVGNVKGRHVVVTDNALCLNEEWSDEGFPFFRFGWSEPLTGAYHESIAAIVSQLQLEIDAIDNRISQCLRLMAIPMWTDEGPTDTGVSVVQIQGGSGAIGDIIQVPPGHKLTRIPAGDIMGPELQNRADKCWSRGFEMTGINESSAVGTRPAGLNSAPAQREWNEINQDRLSLVALDYQQAHVDAGTLLLDAIADIPEYEINIKNTNGRWLKRMKAADLHLEDSDYVIEKFPIGALPLTPTGKIAAAADLLQMKGIEVDEFRDILNFPDLKAKLNVRRATEKATEKIIAKMLKTGTYIAPPDRLDMAYAAKYATAKWLMGIAEDMSQDQMDLLDDWIEDVRQRMTPPTPAVDPAAAGAGADPLAGTSIAPITPAPLAPPPSPEMPPIPGAIAA